MGTLFQNPRKLFISLSISLLAAFIFWPAFRIVIYSLFCGFDDDELTNVETTETRVMTFLFPRNAEYHLRLAHLLGVRRYDGGDDYRLRERVAEYKKTLELDNRRDSAYYSLGLIYLDQGSVDAALFMFKKSVELNPSMPVYHSALAQAYALKGLHDLAKEHRRISDEIRWPMLSRH